MSLCNDYSHRYTKHVQASGTHIQKQPVRHTVPLPRSCTLFSLGRNCSTSKNKNTIILSPGTREEKGALLFCNPEPEPSNLCRMMTKAMIVIARRITVRILIATFTHDNTYSLPKPERHHPSSKSRTSKRGPRTRRRPGNTHRPQPGLGLKFEGLGFRVV